MNAKQLLNNHGILFHKTLGRKMSENDTKKIIESTFDEVSAKYDSNQFFNITAKEIANSFNSHEDCRLLDISTGTGIVALEIAKQHKNIEIKAVDISEGMLNIAKNKAKNLTIKNIVFFKHDVEKLQYENNSFDIITCGFGLFFYPNMKDTFNNLCQMIKKEGKFIFSSFTQEAFTPYSNIFLDTLENDHNIHLPKRTTGLLNTQEEIKFLVTNKNTYEHKVKEVKISYHITVNQWWELLNSAGYKSLLNKLDEQALNTFKTKHLKDIEKLSTNGLIVLKVNTLVTTVVI